MNPDLIKYIQENRPIYTTEAIIRQLLATGYSSADIEAAMLAAGYSATEVQAGWIAMQADISQGPGQPFISLADRGIDQGTQAPPQKSVMASPLFWSVLTGYLLVSLGLPVLLFSVSALQSNNLPFVVCGAFAAVQLAAFITWLMVRNSNPALARALAVGLLIIVVIIPVIAIVLLLVVLGICLVGIGGFP